MTRYAKGDLVLASTTATPGWAIYEIVEDVDPKRNNVLVEIDKVAVLIPKAAVLCKTTREFAKRLVFAMNCAENEEADARLRAHVARKEAQLQAVRKWSIE